MTRRRQAAGTTLPPWRSVLAVVAHPDDESFGLGALLSTFVDAGAEVTVLCFTQGEASTLHGVAGELSRVRAVELESAAGLLGVRVALLRDHPDGALESVDVQALADDVAEVADEVGADGLLVFHRSGVTLHPDHRAATRAALRAAGRLGLPALAWTLPEDVADTLTLEYDAPFVGTPGRRDRPGGARRPRASAGRGPCPCQPGPADQRAVAQAGAPRRPRAPGARTCPLRRVAQPRAGGQPCRSSDAGPTGLPSR